MQAWQINYEGVYMHAWRGRAIAFDPAWNTYRLIDRKSVRPGNGLSWNP